MSCYDKFEGLFTTYHLYEKVRCGKGHFLKVLAWKIRKFNVTRSNGENGPRSAGEKRVTSQQATAKRQECAKNRSY